MGVATSRLDLGSSCKMPTKQLGNPEANSKNPSSGRSKPPSAQAAGRILPLRGGNRPAKGAACSAFEEKTAVGAPMNLCPPLGVFHLGCTENEPICLLRIPSEPACSDKACVRLPRGKLTIWSLTQVVPKETLANMAHDETWRSNEPPSPHTDRAVPTNNVMNTS